MESIPPLRYIDDPVQLPEPATIEQANKNIAYISNLKAQGLIDLDFANSLIADNTTIANNLIANDELKFKIYPPETREQTIQITGGLPRLPGTNVTMPEDEKVNGHTADARALAAPVDVVPNEFPTPGELKAQGPHPLQERHFKPEEPGKNSANGGQEP